MGIDIIELKNHLIDFLTNRVLLCAILSWLTAQILKIFTGLGSKNKQKITFLRVMVGSGGMPSSHSAVVMSTCISCGLIYGFDTAAFAISAVLSVVVMRDAAGVRREAGKQAAAINRVSQELNKRKGKNIMEATLTELLGHTPLQVFFGALLGVVMAFLCQYWLFPLILPVT